MIKILFFIETLSGGGAEKVLRTLVNHMDREKFQITVMTVFPDEAAQLLEPGICYRSLYPRKNSVNLLRYRLEAALGLCCRLHIREKYDVEVAYLECGATKVMASSANKQAAKIAWVHCDLKQKTENLEAFVRKSAPWYRSFQKVVCVSENVRQSYVELFGNDPQAVVLYNVNDEQEILAKAAEGGAPEKRRTTVVTAGRLCEQKGYDRLLEAHRQLIEAGLLHDLWILGEGPDREKLRTLIQTHGLQESVKLLGFQANPYPYFQTADLLVCASRYEGFSTFVTEGLILGKPVVATECTGMRELLGDSKYGLITPNSEQGIYEGLKCLLTDPELRKTYSVQAQLRGKTFQKEELVRKTEAFFQSELAKRRNR